MKREEFLESIHEKFRDFKYEVIGTQGLNTSPIGIVEIKLPSGYYLHLQCSYYNDAPIFRVYALYVTNKHEGYNQNISFSHTTIKDDIEFAEKIIPILLEHKRLSKLLKASK